MAEPIKKVRRVRDPAYWDAPYGTPITGAMVDAKRAQKTGQKARAATSPGRGGRGGVSGGGSAPKTPAAVSGGGKDEYRSRLAQYDKAIAGAKNENDLIKVVDRVQNDSLLNTADYDRVLNAVEHKAGGGDHKPLAKPAKKAAKKPPKKPAPKEEKKPKGPVTRAHEQMREAGLDIPEKKQSSAGEKIAQNLAVNAKNADYEELLDHIVERAKKNLADGKINRQQQIEVLAAVMERRKELKAKINPKGRAVQRKKPSIAERIKQTATNKPDAPEPDTRGGQKTEVPKLADRDMKNLEALIDEADDPAALEDIRGELNELGDAQQRRSLKSRADTRLKEIRGDNPSGRAGFTTALIKANDENEMNGLLDRIEHDKALDDNARNWLYTLASAKQKMIQNSPEFKAALKAYGKDQKAFDSGLSVAFSENQIDSLMAVAMHHSKDGKDSEKTYHEVEKAYDTIIQRRETLAKSQARLGGAQLHSDNPNDDSIAALVALQKHFDGGGDIAGAPNNGLWNFIQNNDRFSVKAKMADGITPKFVVTDTKTGEKWWAKGDRGQHHTPAGAVKELWGAQVLKAIGVKAPEAKLGQNGNFDDLENQEGKFFLQRDYGDFLGVSAKVEGNVYPDGDIEGLIRVGMLDYITDNGDRHGNNIMGIDGQVAYLDFGLGFGYWGVEPPQMTLAEYRRARRWNMQVPRAAMHPEAASHADKVLKELGKIDPDAIRDLAVRQGMDDAVAQQWADMMKHRIEHIRQMSAEDIVAHLR